MKKKRILSVALALALLFTMDQGSFCAMASQAEARQEAQGAQGQQMAQEEDGTPGDDGVPGEDGTPGESGVPGEDAPGESGEPRDNGAPDDGELWHLVSFDLNGGVTAEGESGFSRQVQEGTAVDAATLEEVERKGYFFQGWTDREGNYYDFDLPVMEDITLSASWTPITYRIQFDLDGGEGEAPERQVSYDEEIMLPMNGFSKKNYVLVGWEQENTGIYQEGSAVKNLTSQADGVVVLKAVWQLGEYKVRFDANGGSGTMPDAVYQCGQSKKLSWNKYKRTGYTFAGWNSRQDGKGTAYKQKEKVSFENQKDGGIVVLYAMWQGNSYQVQYNANGGSGKVSPSSHVYGTASSLSANQFTRKGYQFAGWNTQGDGKGETYKNGAKVQTLTSDEGGMVTLYAKWQPVTYTIKYYPRKGKLSQSAKKSYNITTKTFTLPAPTRAGYDFDGWYKDAKCKKRVSQIQKGTTGTQKFYAKWVKCTRKPSTKLGKINTCKATGKGIVKVTAAVKKRVASSDDCYYLVYVNPINKKPYKMAQRAYKKSKISFTLKTSENQGYAISMFGIAVKKKGKYKLISNVSYVKNPEKSASNKSSYKPGKTKKGMQFWDSMEQIDDCKARQLFLNLTVSNVYYDATVPYVYNGKTYYFGRMDYYQQVVSECNKKGITVTMQILLDWVDGQTDLIDSRARKKGAAPYYTWNVSTDAAREKMEAMFCYLGNVFGRKDCYVSNWILGNEINNPRGWNYAGNMPSAYYFHIYAQVFRSLYYAIRSQYSNAHIFICMDNFWNTAVAGGYSVKHAIMSFEEQLQKIQRGIKWNLAYHAYSFPLTYTRFWEGYGITDDANSPFITMKNLNVLTNYIKRTYGSSVRVILSEQGYSSTWGQANQAAALAASYYIAACNPMVDAFIIRSYYDHPSEASQGLAMGIKGKEAFEMYKYMDTTKSHKYTDRYLRLMGLTSWKQIAPGYSKKRIYTMYRK